MFKYHSDMGHCFSQVHVLVVSEKKYFFFTFLNWENQTWYWEKIWLFSIGNVAEIQPLEMGRKSPDPLYFLHFYFSRKQVMFMIWLSTSQTL